MSVNITYSYDKENQDKLSFLFDEIFEKHSQIESLIRVSGNFYQKQDLSILLLDLNPYIKYFETLVLDVSGVRMVLRGMYPKSFNLKLIDNPKDTLDVVCELLESFYMLGLHEDQLQTMIRKRMEERNGV